MKALYPGTFDPLTRGHQDIIRRGLRIFDELVIGIALTNKKDPIFSVEERVQHINDYAAECHSGKYASAKVEIFTYEGLTVDFCKKHDIDIILRGIRNQLDFEYEYPIATVNSKLDPSIETVFVMSDPSISYISSSMVREVMGAGGSVEEFVSPFVRIQLYAKFGRYGELTDSERSLIL